MSAPRSAAAVHLLPADDALTEMRQYGTYMALCGALLTSLPPSLCPPDCEDDCYLYCPECVSVAAAEAGPADRAGGVR